MKLDQFVDELFEVVKDMVERGIAQAATAIAELRAEIKSIPAGKDGAPGRDGENADPAEVSRMVAAAVDAAVKALPVPKDGKDAAPSLVRGIIVEELAKAVAGMPKPKDGRDGRDVDPAILKQFVEAAASAAVAALPKPKDGAPGRDGADAKVDEKLLRETVAAAVAELPKPKDGAPGKDAVVDQQVLRALVAEAVEKIPAPKDGKSADQAEVRALVIETVNAAVAALTKPKDGKDGATGKSAYQIAVERGFVGTELQWLDAMQGRPGKDADAAVTQLMMDAVEAKAPRQLMHDMVDEISRGLAGFGDESEATPAPALSDLANAVTELDKTLKLPITPVFAPDGKTIVAAKRGG